MGVVHLTTKEIINGFVGFVKQEKLIVERGRSSVSSKGIQDWDGSGKHLKAYWDRYAEDYFLGEKIGALADTMYIILDNLSERKGQERWLSLGSGSGIYEVFLAGLLPGVSIVSLDISDKQMIIQRGIMKRFLDQEKRRKIKLYTGSMEDLRSVGRGFDRIFCLDSIHWSSDWRRTVSQISDVLSPDDQARVYLTVSEGRVGKDQRHDVNEETRDFRVLIEEFERNNLQPLILGALNFKLELDIDSYTSRPFGVFRRGLVSGKGWKERVLSNELLYFTYTYVDEFDSRIAGGVVAKEVIPAGQANLNFGAL